MKQRSTPAASSTAPFELKRTPLSGGFLPVITSLLDTDLYKFTMWQTLLHAFPANQSTYRFICRNTPEYPLAELLAEVNEQLDYLCSLRFTEPELAYLGGLDFIKSDFVHFLRIFQLNRDLIKVEAVDGGLSVEATGPQVHTMPYEIYVLSIVNELYFRRFGVQAALVEGRSRLLAKIATLQQFQAQEQARETPRRHPFVFFDFGGRRRFSRAWHEEVVATLVKAVPTLFKGTSNVFLAMKYGLTPMGTMAHEYLQTFQAVGVQLKNFQKAALEAWVQEYRGNLGIALTDVVGMDAFLADFDLYFAKLFDGLRHDSGNPEVWADKALGHYAKLRIDPSTKRLVFSDSLTVPRALTLYDYLDDRIASGFGIGTNLCNDMGLTPLQLVMKLVSCNGQPVAKLPDTSGKTLCDDQTYLQYLAQVFNRVL